MTDKVLHAGTSALLVLVLAVPVVAAGHQPLWLAALLAAGVGAARELAQWRRWLAGQAEWADMAANVVGIAGALLALGALGVR